MCLIQQGDNVASATSQNATIISSDNHTTVVAPNQNTVTDQLFYEAQWRNLSSKSDKLRKNRWSQDYGFILR